MAGTTSFPGGVDDFATTSPTNLGDSDAKGRTHSERHDDMEAAMEAVQKYAPRDRRWVRGSTAHADDDEFNDASLDGDWTRVDASGGSSRATWTEAADSLSLVLWGGDAAGELHALVKAHALAVGDYIETCLVQSGPTENYNNAGLIVADGATHGSGNQVYTSKWHYANQPLQGASWTGYDTRVSFNETTAVLGARNYLRILRDTSNVWRFYTSADGVGWVQFDSKTLTMTPTHVGVAGGTWGGAADYSWSFEYFRIGTA